MKEYNPGKIEPKWQKYWEKEKLFHAKDLAKKPKVFLLIEFPYPSGAGLHVGHCRSNTAMDIIARKFRMQGKNVLYPMGWDAFGLPTENYAIKTGKHPAVATKENTEIFKRQEKSLGFSFDWDREINTTDPKYYKWTQWIFLKMFEKGLAYKAKIPINWCISCKIGLANEEVVDGKCERCGGKIEKREKEQWMLKITKYADRLLQDLDLVDYPERVKTLQKDWVGRSNGWEIKFNVPQAKTDVKIFTTRIDTLFGATYLVLAPEHPLVEKLKEKCSNSKDITEYVKRTLSKSDIERQENKEKIGVKLEGVTATNPANDKQIPIFVADYVLMGYGTGAIMAVPAHDQRDFDFAKKYSLARIKVILPPGLASYMVNPLDVARGVKECIRIESDCWEGEGVLVSSGQFNGLESGIAREKMGDWLESKGFAGKKINYKLRDWVFSRQRYWGEPIPMINCEKCGWVPVPEKDLPVKLPNVKNYQPTETGESPLAAISDWVDTKCPRCKREAERETDVMPNWAGSNWYFMRYCDPDNDKEFASLEKLNYWMPVDWYNGGMEHTTLHLLYSRFVYKFLWDIGAVPKGEGKYPEPYAKRTSHGMILAEGGVKMSKSKGNVVNPEDVIKEYGADTLRIYEMFMGPFSQAIAWDTKGIKGSRRFLEKVWGLNAKCQMTKVKSMSNDKGQKNLTNLIHKTIKKVSEDIESMKFNTAISTLMVLTNEMEKQEKLSVTDYKSLIILLSPFAPHLAEELWKGIGSKKSISLEEWPSYDKTLISEETINLIVQINGKVRDKIKVASGISEEQAKEKAFELEKIKQWLSNKEIKKVIFVPNKLINIVIS